MSFESDIRKFVRKTKTSMDVVVRKVTMDLSNGLVQLSPVDTGRFRGNWMLGIGTPDTSTITAVDPNGSTTMARISSGVPGIKAGGIVYITNSLPYARRLEYGWSQQAPQGMVRITVANYQEYVANIVRGLDK